MTIPQKQQEALKELEKQIDKKLSRIPFEYTRIWGNGYVVDDKDNIIGLSLFGNQIKDIKPLANLTNLTSLDFVNNKIKDIKPLANLTNLTSLHLSGNQISNITSLEYLTSLTSLHLSSNQISDITPLANLTNLTSLYLRFNQISDITPLEYLTNLTSLYLDYNKIKDITPLANLTNLTSLDLSGNQISNITSLEYLTNLTGLNLSSNQISDEDITLLENFTNLTSLDLGYNKINDITPLKNLANLTSLDLSGNQIKDIMPLRALLEDNKKLEISAESFGIGDNFYVGHNPLETPPMEIVAQGRERILSWFEEQKESLNYVKVSVLGNTTSGKSTFINCLDFDDKNEDEILETIKNNYKDNNVSTHGMRIVRKKYNDITVNFWDFGGQEHFHGTYNLFLGGNIVVLVVTGKDEDISTREKLNTRITLKEGDPTSQKMLPHFSYEYWNIKIKRKFNITKNNFFIIQNKIDEYTNKLSLKADSKNVFLMSFEKIDFVELSNKESVEPKKNWQEFRKKLMKAIDDNNIDATLTGKMLLDKFNGDKRTFIELEDLYEEVKNQIEKQENDTEKDLKLRFMDNLKDLEIVGRIFFLGSNTLSTPESKLRFLDKKRDTKIFIDPEYVTNTIYEILDWERLVDSVGSEDCRKVGQFERDAIPREIGEVDTFLELMKQENIIYEYEEDGKIKYVAPQYLMDWKEFKKENRSDANSIIAFKTKANDKIRITSDLIEPWLIVKIISHFGEGQIGFVAWNEGFFYHRHGDYDDFSICIERVKIDGKNKTNDVFDLRVYLKKDKATVEDIEKIKIQILEKIVELQGNNRNTLEVVDIDGQRLSIPDFIEKLKGYKNQDLKEIGDKVNFIHEQTKKEDLDRKVNEKIEKSWVCKILSAINFGLNFFNFSLPKESICFWLKKRETIKNQSNISKKDK